MQDENMRTSVQSQTKNTSHSGSLREMSPAGTNSRSGILPPGSIANKTTTGSALPSRSCRQKHYPSPGNQECRIRNRNDVATRKRNHQNPRPDSLACDIHEDRLSDNKWILFGHDRSRTKTCIVYRYEPSAFVRRSATACPDHLQTGEFVGYP
ncbi:hypothetical protein PHISP_03835 [Aspergillus sp. HF37]|nr:hypothetical protein PHISP_03835 [Aspergillus sp. HF37]